MKTLKIKLLISALAVMVTVQGSFAQANELAQLALNIEKLAQFKSILSNLKKGYDIVSKGYGSVKDLSEGNFKLHKVFLDGLLEVSPTVKKYRKIPEIIAMQLDLVKQSKSALKTFRKEGGFGIPDLDYIRSVYGNLQEQSMQNLDELIQVTTAGKLRMNDEDRLKAIDRIHLDMQEKLGFFYTFNKNTMALAFERKKNQTEINHLKEIQGIRLIN